MSPLRSLPARIKSWVRAATSRSRLESEMEAELAFHLEQYTQDLIRRGTPPEGAARRARIELGGIAVQKEERCARRLAFACGTTSAPTCAMPSECCSSRLASQSSPIMVLRETSWLAGIGVVAGLGMALLLTRFLGSMLFGPKPNDPTTLVSAALLLFAVALLAGFIPARRAARVQPMQALRHE
jgi:hypothetical protein